MSLRLRATGHIDLILATDRTQVTDQVAEVDTATVDRPRTHHPPPPHLTTHPPARSIRLRPAYL